MSTVFTEHESYIDIGAQRKVVFRKIKICFWILKSSKNLAYEKFPKD